MSVRLTTFQNVTTKVALYDSTSGHSFGPIFESEGDAQDFLDHLDAIGERDPRTIPASELASLAFEFMEERE